MLDGYRRNYFLQAHYWLKGLRDPKRALQNIYSAITNPPLYRIAKNVEGAISLHLGVLLYETVRRTRSNSPNVVEVGAFKGLSTIYLSLGASQVGKRVKSFELFSGLPTSDSSLDPHFRIGQFSSDLDEYEANVKAYGCRRVVDLVIGDARETMLPELTDDGFSIAFLDVDVYQVMRELLLDLWSIRKGGEVIIVHDTWSPGVRKALDELHTISWNAIMETEPERGAAKLNFPSRMDVASESRK